MEITHDQKKQSARFRAGAVILCIVYLLYAWVVATQGWVRRWDSGSMTWIQSRISTSADAFLSLISLPGSSEATAVLLFAIFFWALKKRKKKFYSLGFIACILLVEIAGKLLIHHPSPPEETLRYVPLFRLPASSYFQLHNSFPSGHMARTAFTGLLILFLLMDSSLGRIWKKTGSFLIAVLLLVMLISRVSLGIHWMSDVVGGLVLGAAMAAFALSFW